MSSLVTTVTNFLTGEIAVTKPITHIKGVFRIYSGRTKVVEVRRKVPFIKIGRNKLVILPRGKGIVISHISFDGDWTMTRFTFAFDTPVLESFETASPEWPAQRCPDGGSLTVTARDDGEEGLFILTNSGWG